MKIALICLICFCFLVLNMAFKSTRKSDRNDPQKRFRSEQDLKAKKMSSLNNNKKFNKYKKRNRKLKFGNKDNKIKKQRGGQKDKKLLEKKKKVNSKLQKLNQKRKIYRNSSNKQGRRQRKPFKLIKNGSKRIGRKKIKSKGKRILQNISKTTQTKGEHKRNRKRFKDKRRKRNKNEHKSKNNSKTNNKSKSSRKIRQKGKFKSYENVSVSDLYKMKKGKKQLNHIVTVCSGANNDGVTFDVVVPVLEYRDGHDNIILQENPNSNTKITTNITIDQTNEIHIYVEKSYNEALSDGTLQDNNYFKIRTCYDQSKKCVATIENRICINTTFSNVVTKIIESKNSTKDGVPCAFWINTLHVDYGAYVGEYGNRCINRIRPTLNDLRQPRCYDGNEIKDCFHECNSDDLSTAVLNSDNPEIPILLPNGTVLTLINVPETNNSVEVTDKAGHGRYSVLFLRCYDSKRSCVAKLYGPCLETVYPTIVATVLANANTSHRQTPCVSWAGTYYGELIGNPEHNMCLMPTNIPTINVIGPWCMTARGWSNCFPPCSNFSLQGPSLPSFEHETALEGQDIKITGQVFCNTLSYGNVRITFLTRPAIQFEDDAEDHCGHYVTPAYSGRFTIKVTCAINQAMLLRSSIQIKECCGHATCYRYVLPNYVKRSAYTTTWWVEFGKIRLTNLTSNSNL